MVSEENDIARLRIQFPHLSQADIERLAAMWAAQAAGEPVERPPLPDWIEGPSLMAEAVDPDSSPLPARCPVCRHWLVSDGADALICSKRDGCGSEWDFDTIRDNK